MTQKIVHLIGPCYGFRAPEWVQVDKYLIRRGIIRMRMHQDHRPGRGGWGRSVVHRYLITIPLQKKSTQVQKTKTVRFSTYISHGSSQTYKVRQPVRKGWATLPLSDRAMSKETRVQKRRKYLGWRCCSYALKKDFRENESRKQPVLVYLEADP